MERMRAIEGKEETKRMGRLGAKERERGGTKATGNKRGKWEGWGGATGMKAIRSKNKRDQTEIIRREQRQQEQKSSANEIERSSRPV